MTPPRQDFLLQPYKYDGSDEIVYDFPLDDFYIDGVIQPTPYGNSDAQHILDIEMNNIGSIKMFPLLGFGAFQYLNSEFDIPTVFNSLSQQMKSDGYFVSIGAVYNNKGFKINNKLIKPVY